MVEHLWFMNFSILFSKFVQNLSIWEFRDFFLLIRTVGWAFESQVQRRGFVTHFWDGGSLREIGKSEMWFFFSKWNDRKFSQIFAHILFDFGWPAASKLQFSILLLESGQRKKHWKWWNLDFFSINSWKKLRNVFNFRKWNPSPSHSPCSFSLFFNYFYLGIRDFY